MKTLRSREKVIFHKKKIEIKCWFIAIHRSHVFYAYNTSKLIELMRTSVNKYLLQLEQYVKDINSDIINIECFIA